ncbi:MAG: hypothetical protein CVT92_00500 [Bacteroidetes bacterium HGW-Bacteroidetes-1]|jgi:hypothetical protein|nr:MAG: hypothetical protein CVT92_00500 [Bacteroidetes bacterium HGW-Bacteroidetes-1]
MKKRVVESFLKYLQNKGFKNIKLIEPFDQNSISDQNLAIENELNVDISAESNGVFYFYKYVEGKKAEQSQMLDTCRTYQQNKNEKPSRLRLLVPAQNSDAVIQSLNSHQFENVGVVRINSARNH